MKLPTRRSNACIKRIDNRTVRNVSATAFCDHRPEPALKPAQVGNLPMNRLEIGACHGVDFAASQRALVNQPKHGANFVQTEAKVALIGHGTIGGTCVNVGCVPSKAMIRAVEPLHQTRAAGRFDGITVQASLTDWRAVRDQKDALVKELRNAKYVDLLPAYDGVDYIEGKAHFMAEGLNVDGHPLDAENPSAAD